MGDAPEARVGLGEEPLDVGFARNVGRDRDRLTAGPFYLGDDRRSSVGVPMVVHDDGVAALSGESAGGGADAAAAAGDDEYFTGHQ